MAEAAAAVVEDAAPAVEPSDSAVLEKHAGAIRARESGAEAPAAAKPAPVEKAKHARPAPQAIAALSAREWKAQQQEKEAQALKGRYSAIETAIEKKDLRGALELLIKDKGFEFKHVVDVLTQEKEPEKTAEQLAEEKVNAVLAERDRKEHERLAAQRSEETKAQLGKVHSDLAALAEKGTAEDPNRWELSSLVSNVGEEAWEIIEGHYIATAPRDAEGRIAGDGEKLSFEQALDLIEGKLKTKRDARRPKTDAGNPTVGDKPRDEAASTGKGGRAAEPSFGNRATSIAPAKAAVPERETADEPGLSEAEHIRRAAARAKIKLT